MKIRTILAAACVALLPCVAGAQQFDLPTLNSAAKNNPPPQASQTFSTFLSPTTTVSGAIVLWSGITGTALSDSGYSIGTTGHVLCALDQTCNFSTAPTVNGSPIGGGVVGSMLINGDMDVSQRYEDTANSTGLDRWFLAVSSGNGLTLQRNTDAPIGYIHSLKATNGASGITPAATDGRNIRQNIEGSMLTPLSQWGTANGQPATLTGQIKCSVAGTYAHALQNSTGTESYVSTVTVGAGVWTPFVDSIPAPPVASAWNTFSANQAGARLLFDLGSGSNLATANVGIWQAANYYTTPTATELVATGSATCQFAAIHLFAGSSAPTYVPRPYSAELALAQRYYKKTFNEGVAATQNAGLAGSLCVKTAAATAYASRSLSFPSGIYTGSGASPTVTTYNPSAANASWRDVTAAADVAVAVDPSTAKGGTEVEITTSATVATAGDNLCIHATYDSGYN